MLPIRICAESDKTETSFLESSPPPDGALQNVDRRSSLVELAKASLEAVMKYSPVSPFPNWPNSDRPAVYIRPSESNTTVKFSPQDA